MSRAVHGGRTTEVDHDLYGDLSISAPTILKIQQKHTRNNQNLNFKIEVEVHPSGNIVVNKSRVFLKL